MYYIDRVKVPCIIYIDTVMLKKKLTRSFEGFVLWITTKIQYGWQIASANGLGKFNYLFLK